MAKEHGKMRGERGAAALEYILISTFAVALSVAAVAILTKMVKDELGTMGEHLGVSIDTSPLDAIGGTP